MKIINLLALAFSFLMFNSANAIEVTDFKFGLVCPDSETKSAWICHEMKNIKISGQAICTYNKNKVPCTWYDFSFKYKNHNIGQKINCVGVTSYPITLGNPEAEDASISQEHKYNFELKEESGFFVNPQYTVYAVKSPDKRIYSSKVECSVGDKIAFKYGYNIIYPVK